MTRAVAAAVVSVALVVAPAGAGASAIQVRSDGAPIAVMTMGEFFANPQWPVAVKARFADLNRAGGIKDAAGTRHRVKVIVCDTEADPVQTQQCAQRAVDDRVVAVVGMSVLDSDPVWPLLEAAGIPVIGSRINTDRDVSSPVAFPLGSGIVGTFSAMPQLLVRQGARKVAVVMSDFGAATSSALGLIASGLSRTTASAGPVVRVPLGVKSLAPYASAATRDAVDGVIVFLERKEQAGLLRSLEVAHFRGRIVTQASLSITGNPAIDDGTLGVGEFPPVTARGRGMKLFRSDMVDAGISSSGLLGLDAGALNFWLAAWVFERVAQGLPAIDSATLQQAMGNIGELDMGGVTPPLSTSVQNAEFPRLFNPTVTLNTVKHGKLSRISDRFLDPVTGELR